MAELSERSGVPIPTIRYYLREGLLPQGRFTRPNQASYDEAHVHRLGLIRAMVEIGEMPIATVGKLFRHLENPSPGGGNDDESRTLGLVQYALVRQKSSSAEEAPADGSDVVSALLDRLSWNVREQHPARSVLAAAVGNLRRLGQDDILALLDRYAAAAHELAEAEVALTLARTGIDQRAEAVVLVGVLGDAMLGALRRLAQEDVVTREIGVPTDAPAPATSDRPA
ncbi:MerR family transcriptional regulator [Herbidospora sp. NBRC 101105]|uniref:MerR family transcriptional regulator n=1 Tax=Herbidospora sp. NBRC 101105 TaxID=3032195 RepID=UPI0025524313|nr:MerR family transcriptional regulator [Herbidospora sp. NBRC 101105]